MGISKQELVSMLEEEELKKAVLLVFANKQDLPGACSETEVSKHLGLSALKNRTWTIFKTSAKKGEGLTEAMDWYVCKPTVRITACGWCLWGGVYETNWSLTKYRCLSLNASPRYAGW